MSLYAIGDLHLHFQTARVPPGQIRDKVWKNHEQKLWKNCCRLIQSNDTLLLLGDHSWGRSLAECEEDFNFIKGLPGKKILLRGNHDMFWDAKKTMQLNEHFSGNLSFLQNNYYAYQEYALVGTKGFTFEGPYYLDRRGRIIGWDEKAEEHAKKIIAREIVRLRASFEAAKSDGFEKYIMLLHYPPTNILEKASVFTAMAEEYHVQQVLYAHCHGEYRFHDSILGEMNNVQYRLVSGDFLKWNPVKVLD